MIRGLRSKRVHAKAQLSINYLLLSVSSRKYPPIENQPWILILFITKHVTVNEFSKVIVYSDFVPTKRLLGYTQFYVGFF